MTTTNAELIAAATTFKAAMRDANTDAPAPGSILDLWLRTADALEAVTTITDRVEHITNNRITPKTGAVLDDYEEGFIYGFEQAMKQIAAAPSSPEEAS